MKGTTIGSTYTPSGGLNPRAYSTISSPSGQRLTWGQASSMFAAQPPSSSGAIGAKFGDLTSNIRSAFGTSGSGMPTDRIGRAVEGLLRKADRALGTGGSSYGPPPTDQFGRPLEFAQDRNKLFQTPTGQWRNEIVGNYGASTPLAGVGMATNRRYV